MIASMRFYDNLYFNEDIQKTTFWCFEIWMAPAGTVSPGDFKESRFNCTYNVFPAKLIYTDRLYLDTFTVRYINGFPYDL